MPLNPQAGEFKLSPAAAAFTPGAPVPQESRGEWGVALCAPPGAQGATSTDGAAAAPATPQGAWGRKGPSVAEKLRQEKERREEEERKRELDGLMAREAEAATPPTPEAATPPGAPARLEPSALSEDETVAHTETPKTASESGEEGGAHSGRSHAPAWHNAPPVAGGVAAAGGASGSVGSATSTGPELEMDFDDAIEHAGLHEDRSDRDRERSLSPRERFYGEDDGEVPVLLWAPSPYNDSPLYQGFGFSREELDDLRSPNTLRELAATNVARESWFSGCSAHSDDWSESASGTPASQGGQGAWADDEPRAHSRSRVSQVRCVACDEGGTCCEGARPAVVWLLPRETDTEMPLLLGLRAHVVSEKGQRRGHVRDGGKRAFQRVQLQSDGGRLRHFAHDWRRGLRKGLPGRFLASMHALKILTTVRARKLHRAAQGARPSLSPLGKPLPNSE